MFFALILCNALVARPFNELIELSIERLDYSAVDLLLKQTSITKYEQQIFLKQIQDIIDELNDEVVPFGEHKGAGKLFLAGVCASGTGIWVDNQEDRAYTKPDIRKGRILMVAGGLLTVFSIIKALRWFRQEIRIDSAKSRLTYALWIKSSLEHARIKGN